MTVPRNAGRPVSLLFVTWNLYSVLTETIIQKVLRCPEKSHGSGFLRCVLSLQLAILQTAENIQNLLQ